MSTLPNLLFRYLHRQLAASGDTPAQYTASAGSINSAVCAALDESADYWIGAILRWDTGDNAGLYSSVLAFAEATLTLKENLPNAVASGDTFTLFVGGLYATNQRVPGMTTSAPANITGLSIDYAAMLNSPGTGTLRYYHAAKLLTWQPPGESEGTPVSIASLAEGQSATLSGAGDSIEQQSKTLTVNRTAAALPVADASDDVHHVSPTGTFLGLFHGTETEAGLIAYRPVALQNTAASAIHFLKAYCRPSPWPGALATTIAAAGAIGTGAGELLADDFSNWGSQGWIYNATKNDLRYFFNRSGNTMTILDPDGGMRDFSAVAWDAGDEIEPYPWMDIGLDAPAGGSAFEDPDGESTAPSGVAFSCPRTLADALSIGTLAPASLHVIWQRFTIPAGFHPLENARADLRVHAQFPAQ